MNTRISGEETKLFWFVVGKWCVAIEEDVVEEHEIEVVEVYVPSEATQSTTESAGCLKSIVRKQGSRRAVSRNEQEPLPANDLWLILKINRRCCSRGLVHSVSPPANSMNGPTKKARIQEQKSSSLSFGDQIFPLQNALMRRCSICSWAKLDKTNWRSKVESLYTIAVY
jgi:hypothetical protein